MKVLLTGATGFVGSHVAREFLKAGHTVYAIVRPMASRWRIEDIVSSLVVIEGDLAELPALRERLRSLRPDLCVHLAWRGLAGSPVEQNLSSLSQSLEFIQLMAKLGCRRLMIAGSCFEYDIGDTELSEESPLKPFNLYGASKHALFLVAREFERLGQIQLSWPRIFYIYGPGEDPHRLVPSVILALLRNEVARTTRGEQIRDYLHVEDVAGALRTIAESGVTGPINVASGISISVAEVVNVIGRLLKKSQLVRLGALPYRPGEPMVIKATTTFLQRTVGWKPRYGIVEGLQQTIQWWRDHS